MPRGGRRSSGRSSPTFGRAPPPAPRAPPKPASSVPAARPASNVAQPAQAAPQQPGLIGQMASTAAGVAIGSTVVCYCTEQVVVVDKKGQIPIYDVKYFFPPFHAKVISIKDVL